MSRVISYSEITAALDCEGKWDFRYGDQLAGSSLKEKQIAPLLSGGRAWGAAIAAWHTHLGNRAGKLAINAMDASLQEDADKQREHGVFDQHQHDELRTQLLQILLHHINSVDPIPMDAVTERELLVPIPSRSGKRSSSRYKLLCYLDATETVDDGSCWIDEFKLRKSLTDARLIANSRQTRWYAWALWRETGRKVRGAWVNERLNVAPKQPRILKSGKPSHAKDQMCSVEAYEAVCREHQVETVEETVQALRARRWHQRVPILFRDGELEEVGKELVSAAQLLGQLDRGERYPLRNVKRANCNWCAYREICPSPDNDLVEALFERVPAKRNRISGPEPTTEGAADGRSDT